MSSDGRKFDAAARQQAASPDVVAQLGGRLRARRAELGLTLQQIGERAGVSVSYLSTLERGVGVPSLSVLARVARALDLGLSALLRDASASPVCAGTFENVAAGAHPMSADGLRVEAVSLVVGPGDAGACPLSALGPELFVHVRKGSLSVRVGAEQHVLGRRDTLLASSPAGVQWAAEAASVSIWATVPAEG